jgi:hypothetical protein
MISERKKKKRDYGISTTDYATSKISIYIKMNRRSLVSLKLKNGLTDLNIYFFILFALLQGWFKKKKKSEKLPGKLENSGKTESAFL